MHEDYADMMGLDVEFQFPSNGKAYMHIVQQNIGTVEKSVFQFPSNGKAYMVLAISS